MAFKKKEPTAKPPASAGGSPIPALMPYTVQSPSVEIPSGVIGLTDAQAELRKHNLVALGDGKFGILAPIVFKRGETIELEAELPKGMAL